MLDERNTTM